MSKRSSVDDNSAPCGRRPRWDASQSRGNAKQEDNNNGSRGRGPPSFRASCGIPDPTSISFGNGGSNGSRGRGPPDHRTSCGLAPAASSYPNYSSQRSSSSSGRGSPDHKSACGLSASEPDRSSSYSSFASSSSSYRGRGPPDHRTSCGLTSGEPERTILASYSSGNESRGRGPPSFKSTCGYTGATDVVPSSSTGFGGRGPPSMRQICGYEGTQSYPSVSHRFESIPNDQSREVMLHSNAFELKFEGKWSMCKHHVNVDPEELPSHARIGLIKQHKRELGEYVFDGSTLFTNRNLCPDGNPIYFTSERKDGHLVKFTIQFVGTIEPSESQYLQFFNVLFRGLYSRLQLQQIRRDYFDPQAKIVLKEHPIELWPGYRTSIKQGPDRIFLQAEITYKMLRRDTAYDKFREICNRNPGSFPEIKKLFNNAMLGVIVMTRYNNKTYRIDEVDFECTPEKTFLLKKNKKEISFMDYYENRYQIKINDRRQPMMISRSSRKDQKLGMPELVYLVPELCLLTGLSDELRANTRLMKEISNNLNVSPSERIKRLLNFNKRLNDVPEIKQKLENWKLKLADTLIEVPCRVLGSTRLTFGNGRSQTIGQNADWTQTFRNNTLLSTRKLDNWAIIYSNCVKKDIQKFLLSLTEVARGMSLTIEKPELYEVNDHAWEYTNMFESVVNRQNPQIVMFVVRNDNSERYNAIKKKAILEKSVLTQVVRAVNVSKNNKSVCTKIAIQMNCKIGYAPWCIRNIAKGIMVVGVDISSKSKSARRGCSALVATMNQDATKFFSSVFEYEREEVLSKKFLKTMNEAVLKYREANGCLPEDILIFRDGVSEGDLNGLMDREVDPVIKSTKAIYEKMNQTARICFMTVSKKINTRLFFGDANPPPGTVADKAITNHGRFDFYMVCQSVRFGTVSPTHYNAMYNSTGLKESDIQGLTYKLSHLYYNWTGTVRVPAVCLYARKLAALTADSIKTEHRNLENLLYFL